MGCKDEAQSTLKEVGYPQGEVTVLIELLVCERAKLNVHRISQFCRDILHRTKKVSN